MKQVANGNNAVLATQTTVFYKPDVNTTGHTQNFDVYIIEERIGNNNTVRRLLY